MLSRVLQYAPVGQTWRDPESLEDVPLVPGMTPVENQLRWGFVQKVGPASVTHSACSAAPAYALSASVAMRVCSASQLPAEWSAPACHCSVQLTVFTTTLPMSAC